MGYSPWGGKESDETERLTPFFFKQYFLTRPVDLDWVILPK